MELVVTRELGHATLDVLVFPVVGLVLCLGIVWAIWQVVA